MRLTGTIPIENAHGVECHVSYVYDQALDKLQLFPSGRFTSQDVDHVMRISPNFIKACILFDIQDKAGLQALKKAAHTLNRPAIVQCAGSV